MSTPIASRARRPRAARIVSTSARRAQRLPTLFAASLLAVLLAAPAASALDDAQYDARFFRVPANDAVPPATIAGLLGAGTAPSAVSEGRWSADHSRLLYVVNATNAANDNSSLWVMRSDGTQRTKLGESSYYSSDRDAVWVDDDTVTWMHASPYLHDSSSIQWRTVTATGPADTWAVETEPGYVTLDGRYRVHKPIFKTYSASPIRATELATGRTYTVKTPSYYGDPVTHWHPACRMPDGATPPDDLSVEQTLVGSRPICDFAVLGGTPPPVPETRLDYPSSFYAPPPAVDEVDPTLLRELTTANMTFGPATDGVWAPDRQHIAFRNRNASKPGLTKGGTIWAMRADGTQITKLGDWIASDEYFYDGNPTWLDDHTVSWTAYSIRAGGTHDVTKRLTVRPNESQLPGSPTTFDAWADAAPALRGRATLDGRFRVVKTWPDASGAAPVSAIEIATGTEYGIGTPPHGAQSAWLWSPDCQLTRPIASGATPTAEEAIGGPDPICSFARDATPTPAPTASPAPGPAATPLTTNTPPPAATPAPTPVPAPGPIQPTVVRSPIVIVSFAKSLQAARTKGLRLRLQSTGGTVAAKVWLLGKGGTLASRSIPKLAPGATTVALPRARKLGKARTSVTIRVATVDAAGRRTTVERTADLLP